jgi:hypothetical protein
MVFIIAGYYFYLIEITASGHIQLVKKYRQ